MVHKMNMLLIQIASMLDYYIIATSILPLFNLSDPNDSRCTEIASRSHNLSGTPGIHIHSIVYNVWY